MLFYSNYPLYTIGQFVILSSLRELDFEIHARTRQYDVMSGTTTTLCAVAVTEQGETIILDMCNGVLTHAVRFASETSTHHMTLTLSDRNRLTVSVSFKSNEKTHCETVMYYR